MTTVMKLSAKPLKMPMPKPPKKPKGGKGC